MKHFKSYITLVLYCVFTSYTSFGLLFLHVPANGLLLNVEVNTFKLWEVTNVKSAVSQEPQACLLCIAFTFLFYIFVILICIELQVSEKLLLCLQFEIFSTEKLQCNWKLWRSNWNDNWTESMQLIQLLLHLQQKINRCKQKNWQKFDKFSTLRWWLHFSENF